MPTSSVCEPPLEEHIRVKRSHIEYERNDNGTKRGNERKSLLGSVRGHSKGVSRMQWYLRAEPEYIKMNDCEGEGRGVARGRRARTARYQAAVMSTMTRS